MSAGGPVGAATPRLALFDLDHTLLTGDSDVLWCDFLIDQGVLDRATFEPRNRDMAVRYGRGAATAEEYCGFYAQTLAGPDPAALRELRARWFEQVVAPRLGAAARGLVERHRDAGDRLVLTTATNRFLTEPTARALRIGDLIATEPEAIGERFTGRIDGVPNMRADKVTRLRAWLASQALDESALREATFYSDSANDLPLLRQVGHPVAVDPDPVLEAEALQQGWTVMRLAR